MHQSEQIKPQLNMSSNKETDVSANNFDKQILVEVSWLKKISAILLVAVILQTAFLIFNFFTK